MTKLNGFLLNIRYPIVFVHIQIRHLAMVSQTLTDIDAFIDHLIAEDIKSNLRDFTLELHGRFYPHMNIEFMDEFLTLAARENENQFIVNHDMLIKYGVVTKGAQSSDVKTRLKGLGYVEKRNYLLRKLSEQHKSGTKHVNVYMLTPEAFFRALQRAQQHSKHDVDPTIYADYFQFIQKAFLFCP